MTLRTALALINQTLTEVLTEQEDEFDNDTRWALAWYEQHGFEEGEFGQAELLSKAKATSVRGPEEAGIVCATGGKVRLLRPDELPKNWNPGPGPAAYGVGDDPPPPARLHPRAGGRRGEQAGSFDSRPA